MTALAAVLLVTAAAVVALRIDLGPSLRGRAEAAGSGYVHRPLRIGRLGMQLWSGRFVVENLVIEGLKPTDPPFFTAKTIPCPCPGGAS